MRKWREDTVGRRQCHPASEKHRKEAWGQLEGGHQPGCRAWITSGIQLTVKQSLVSAPGFAILNARKCLLLPFLLFLHRRLSARWKPSQQATQISSLPKLSITISWGLLKVGSEPWQRPSISRRLSLILLRVLAWIRRIGSDSEKGINMILRGEDTAFP